MNSILIGSAAVSGTVLYIVLILALLYFFFMRPQRKQQQMRDKMLKNLKPNTHIMTAGGITGYIRSVGDEYVYVEIADGLVIELLKSSVAKILDDDEAAEDAVEAQNQEETQTEAEENASAQDADTQASETAEQAAETEEAKAETDDSTSEEAAAQKSNE